MAPKRSFPLDDPPASSSSEEEEISSGGEEEDVSEEGTSSEDEEEEKVDFKLKKSAPLPSSASATDQKVASKKQDPPMILQAQESSSASGSESESESETESESKSESESDAEAEENAKPISSKPMEETPKRQKLWEDADMTVRSSVKWPSRSRETKSAKKGSEALFDDGAATEHDSKKTGDESKKLFQRVWSEEDEIVIIKGISDYTAKKGFEPPADMNDFHDFIQKYLHVDVSRSQLRDKVWRLKKKYKNNVRRGKKGEDPTFTKPHERKAFELSKKVWGDEIETPFSEQPVFNGTPRKCPMESSSKSLNEELFGMLENVKENDKMHADGNLAPSECLNELLDFNKNRGVIGPPKNVLKRGLELIEGSKKAELEEQWEKLHFAELELFVRRTEIVRDQARLILEAYRSSSE